MSSSLDPSPSDLDRLPCPICGGSGVLRLNHHRFRTCLECAGQGVVLHYTGSSELTRLLQRQAETGTERSRSVPAELGVNAETVSAASR